MRFFLFSFFFLTGIFSHFRLLMRRWRKNFPFFLSSWGIYPSKLTFFSPSAVFSLKNNPHSFLRRELYFWQLALSSSIFSPSSFSRLFTVVFPPLWVHTPTLRQLSFFSVFLIPNAQWNCNYFAHTTFRFWPLFFFALFSYDFSFLHPISLQRQRKIHHCWRHFPGEFSFSSSCGMLDQFLHQFPQNDGNFICSLLSVLLFILKKMEQKVSLTFILSPHEYSKKKNPARQQSIQSDSSRP